MTSLVMMEQQANDTTILTVQLSKGPEQITNHPQEVLNHYSLNLGLIVINMPLYYIYKV